MATTAALKVSVDNIILGKGFLEAAREFKMQTPGKSALVLGGTGEVGREVIKHLLASDAFDRVTVFTRRPIDITGTNSDKVVQKPVDFENIAQLERNFAGHTHAFSCLGASRWKNGSDGFYKVDHDYMLNAATACKKVQVENYYICSTKGADKTSRFLYARVKGEVDDEVMTMGFAHASVYRPGMIECDRVDARPLERIFSYLLPVVKLVFPKSAAVSSSTIAWSMVFDALKPSETSKSVVFENSDMMNTFEKNQ
ncbi:Oxidoreductase htatip2 [Kickxella alabastrina]|uniref:Oxidoreductase htatip2 n=1 Tax=Kickxella alabastrina TaxID=61397 RepID=A0ACC1ITH0_9FUNG|nr:Oxidoreductase htatip2 [Kickxella alabastrina]